MRPSHLETAKAVRIKNFHAAAFNGDLALVVFGPLAQEFFSLIFANHDNIERLARTGIEYGHLMEHRARRHYLILVRGFLICKMFM